MNDSPSPMRSGSSGRSVRCALLLLLAICCVLSRAVAEPASGGNLLAGLSPIQNAGVRAPGVLSDGIAVRDGDTWKTDRTARFAGPQAFVDFDMGAERQISAVWLQGDNNDEYDVLLSHDGRNFEPFWRADPQSAVGMQPRFARDLTGHGRYVRLQAGLGDDALAVSELQLFDRVPTPFPPELRKPRGVPLERIMRDHTLLFGLALAVAVALASERAGRVVIAALALFVAVSAGLLWQSFSDAWPISPREISLVRAVVAAVAALAIAREAFAPRRYPAERRVTRGVLGVCAVLGFLAFYDLGQPQFYDVGQRASTFAHHLDLRQYYPIAKYFRELGYRGLYEADAAAEAEERGTTLEAIGSLTMRDLSNSRESTVREQMSRIVARRLRFGDERWQAYKQDARFFRDAMGSDQYLRTMLDFGGNATPVWMSIAHILFSALPPSNATFTWTGFIDAGLILLALVAIARAFGRRTAFVCAVLFGANDFIMYGTNWAGATLRHDWLAYLALGVAALKRERWLLGGAFFGLSTMIRAFPALALVGVSFQAFWFVIDFVRAERRRPTLRELLDGNRAVLRVLAGGALAIAGFYLFSIIVLPASAWPEWYHKAVLLETDPHPATIGLRPLLGGWEGDQGRVLRARAPIVAAFVLAYGAAIVCAARGRSVAQSAVLGLVCLPLVFSPSNYYFHVIFVYPLLVSERAGQTSGGLEPADAGIWLCLLGLCTAQYLPALIPDFPLHFYLENAMLFATLAAILLLLNYARLKAWFTAALPEQPATSGE